MTLTCSTQWTNAHVNSLPIIDLQSKESSASFLPPLDERVSQARENAFEGIHSLTQPTNRCAVGLIGGAAGSLIVKHPMPFLLGLTECIPSVWAQEKIGSEFQVNTYTTSYQQDSSVAALSSGNFVVTWQSQGQDGDNSGIYGQIFNGTSSKVGSEFQVNNYTTSLQRSSSVASMDNGNFVISWESWGQDGDEVGVFGQIFDETAVKVGAEFQVNNYIISSQEARSVVGLNNGNFVVVWQSSGQDGDQYGVYGQIFDATAVRAGTEFQVNNYTTSTQKDPSVESLNNGNFVVTWASDGQDGSAYGVYGQIFDATGLKLGAEFQVNTNTISSQQDQTVASLNNGNFVVSWMSNGQDGDSWGVYGQIFDATATKIGAEFQVNTNTTLGQLFPSATGLSNGNFIISWHSNSQDGDSSGIYGQIFDATGSKVGLEFQVNTYTTSSQNSPSVARLNNGNFVISWRSLGQDGDNYGVYGQVFYDNITQIATTGTTGTTGTSGSTGIIQSTAAAGTTATTAMIPSSSTTEFLPTTGALATTRSNPPEQVKTSSTGSSNAPSWLWAVVGAAGAACLSITGFFLYKKRGGARRETSLEDSLAMMTPTPPAALPAVHEAAPAVRATHNPTSHSHATVESDSAEDGDTAIGGAEELMELAAQLQKAIKLGKTPEATQACKALFAEGRHHVARVILQDRHANPLPIALKLVEALAHPGIQFEDELKGEIARAARLFVELTAFKCFQEQRSPYPATMQAVRDQLTKIHTDLSADKNQERSNNQLQLHFNVTCCLEALKAMEAIDYTSFVMDMVKIIKKGSVSTAISRIRVLHGQLGKSWFSDLLFISWMGGLCTKDVDAFNTVAADISRLSKKEPKIALGSVEFYGDMIHRGSPKIQSQALEGLIEIANLRGGRMGRSYWKARYQAVQHLHALYLHSDAAIQERASTALLLINACESHKNIRDLFDQIEQDPEIIQQWKEQFVQENAALWEQKDQEEQSLTERIEALEARESKLTQQADSKALRAEREQVRFERESVEQAKFEFEMKGRNLEHLKDLLAKQVNNLMDEMFSASAAQVPVAEIPESYLCPITRQLMIDPVMAPSGHSYEKSAILTHLRDNDFDPMTREPLKKRQLHPNRALKDAIEALNAKQEGGSSSTESSSSYSSGSSDTN